MVVFELDFKCMDAQCEGDSWQNAGAEFYVQAWPELEGQHFAEVSLLP